MEHCNKFPKTTKVEAPLGIDANGSEAKIDWTNSYDSVIGMMLYLASNTRPYISFAVHQCAWFTHNTKESNKTAVKSICQPSAPPGGRGRGAPGAPRRRPGHNMLRARRNVPKCKDGVGEMALEPLAVMVAREYSLLCMNYGNV